MEWLIVIGLCLIPLLVLSESIERRYRYRSFYMPALQEWLDFYFETLHALMETRQSEHWAFVSKRAWAEDIGAHVPLGGKVGQYEPMITNPRVIVDVVDKAKEVEIPIEGHVLKFYETAKAML